MRVEEDEDYDDDEEEGGDHERPFVLFVDSFYSSGATKEPRLR